LKNLKLERADQKFNVLSAAFSVRSKFRVRSGRWTKNS